MDHCEQVQGVGVVSLCVNQYRVCVCVGGGGGGLSLDWVGELARHPVKLC